MSWSSRGRPRHDHAQWSLSETEREISSGITRRWNLSVYTNELLYKTETGLGTSKTNLRLQKKKKKKKKDELRLALCHTRWCVPNRSSERTHRVAQRTLLNTLFRARIDIHLHISESSSWTPKNLHHKSVLFQYIIKKAHTKDCANCCTAALISHASRATLKIPQGGLQQDMNW